MRVTLHGEWQAAGVAQGHLQAKLPVQKDKDLLSHIVFPPTKCIFEVKCRGEGRAESRRKLDENLQDQELVPFSLLF